MSTWLKQLEDSYEWILQATSDVAVMGRKTLKPCACYGKHDAGPSRGTDPWPEYGALVLVRIC